VLFILSNPIPKLQRAPLPPKVLQAKKTCPQFLALPLFSLHTFESIKELGSASPSLKACNMFGALQNLMPTMPSTLFYSPYFDVYTFEEI
jgi:hypothetical protein